MENSVSSGDTWVARWNFDEDNTVGQGTTGRRGSHTRGSKALIIRWRKDRIRDRILSPYPITTMAPRRSARQLGGRIAREGMESSFYLLGVVLRSTGLINTSPAPFHCLRRR
jgi:hypothetical protein